MYTINIKSMIAGFFELVPKCSNWFPSFHKEYIRISISFKSNFNFPSRFILISNWLHVVGTAKKLLFVLCH